MAALTISSSTSLYRPEGKLFSSRLDIPIPSKHELGLKQFYLTKLDGDSSNKDQCSIYSIKTRETELVQVRTLNPYRSEPVTEALRWAFNEVIKTCSYLQNTMLAEQLLAQV